MAFAKGARLFGHAPTGAAFPPSNVPLGVFAMLCNTALTACVTLMMKEALQTCPVLSAVAAQSLVTSICLLAGCALTTPALAWQPTGSAAVAVVYGGLCASALNNVLITRANKHLGSLVSTVYMPVQPLTTLVVDFLALGDAVYAASLVRPVCLALRPTLLRPPPTRA